MKFKVGDKVRLIEETTCTLGFRVGDICKVTKIDIDRCFYPIQIENDTTIGFVTEANIELIEERGDKINMNFELYNDDSQLILPEILSNLDNNKVIIVTDPPFNIGYHYNTYKDNLNEDEYYEALQNIFQGNKCVVVHYPEQLYKLAFQLGLLPEKVISWVYNSNTAKQHRDIAFFGIKPNMNQVTQPYKNPNDKRILERIKRGCKGAKLYDWWEINQVKNVSKEKTSHPCQMPIEVMKRIVGILPYDAIIIDTFMGSGTTGLAVELMNREQNADRKFIGIEIDREYFEIAKKRLNNLQKSIDNFAIL